MAQPTEKQDHLAADLLIDHIERPDVPIRHLSMQSHLVVRRAPGEREGG